MHIQVPPPGWLDAVNALPPYAVVKAVSDPSILVSAKQRWTSLGRDPRQLFTVYRHFDIQPANAGSWQSAVDHWRQMFARYVDKTYLEQYAPHVDFVLDANEYTARSTWTDPADKARVLQSMQAAATVWNDSYRGKEVHSADGGVGHIPDWCKFCLMCGPVNNPWPVEVFNIALDNDCPISYHAYTRYQNKQRYVNDWPEDSGLWDALERQYGRKPQWLFGEVGPYLNSAEGWRSPNVLGGDENALNAAMLAWWQDCAKTAAYADGRLIGAGAWFTSGGGASWQFYELQSQQLIRLAQTNAGMWHPGTEIEVDKNKILTQLTNIDNSTAAIRAELLPYQVRAKNPLPCYDKPSGKVVSTFTDSRLLDVWEVQGTWYRVTKAPANILWCLSGDTLPL